MRILDMPILGKIGKPTGISQDLSMLFFGNKTIKIEKLLSIAKNTKSKIVRVLKCRMRKNTLCAFLRKLKGLLQKINPFRKKKQHRKGGKPKYKRIPPAILCGYASL